MLKTVASSSRAGSSDACESFLARRRVKITDLRIDDVGSAAPLPRLYSLEYFLRLLAVR
jgi:hypothetical protein